MIKRVLMIVCLSAAVSSIVYVILGIKYVLTHVVEKAQ